VKRDHGPAELKPVETVIVEAIRYDHSNDGNVRRILDGLREAGWRLTPASAARLPETMRIFSDRERHERR
jgi:hypothetical protein